LHEDDLDVDVGTGGKCDVCLHVAREESPRAIVGELVKHSLAPVDMPADGTAKLNLR
jgi:hypothetical protein